MSIIHDEILGGEPRIEGARIGVRHIVALSIDGGHSPAYVADQFDISISKVYEALAYYYANPEEVHAAEQENQSAFDALRDTEERLTPKEPVQE